MERPFRSGAVLSAALLLPAALVAPTHAASSALFPPLVLPLAEPFNHRSNMTYIVIDLDTPLHLANFGLDASAATLARDIVLHGNEVPWLAAVHATGAMERAVEAAFEASRCLAARTAALRPSPVDLGQGATVSWPEAVASGAWANEFLRLRSTVLVPGATLKVRHPSSDGAEILGDEVSVQLEFCLVASATEDPVFDFRQLVLRSMGICLSLDGLPPSCGPVSEMLEVHYDGLEPGIHSVVAWAGLLTPTDVSDVSVVRQAGGEDQMPSFNEELLAARCTPFRGGVWVFEETRRTFSIAPKKRAARPPASCDAAEDDRFAALGTAVTCGTFTDGSEWCHYEGGACLNLESFELELLPPQDAILLDESDNVTAAAAAVGVHGSSSGDAPAAVLLRSLGRLRDETRFTSAGATARDLRAPWALPLRSAARARWVEPWGGERHWGGRPGGGRSGGGGAAAPAVAWVPGPAVLPFIDCPHNIVHVAGKLFQAAHAADHLGLLNPSPRDPSPPSSSGARNTGGGGGGGARDSGAGGGGGNGAVGAAATVVALPLTCGRGPAALAGGAACGPALEDPGLASRRGAAAWLTGLAGLLFGQGSVVANPRAFAAAQAAGGQGVPGRLCFSDVVVPGESRALFRGLADARRFRRASRSALGLSPVRPRPGPLVVVVQRRSGGRGVGNLDAVLAELRALLASGREGGGGGDDGGDDDDDDGNDGGGGGFTHGGVRVVVAVLETMTFEDQVRPCVRRPRVHSFGL